MRTLGCEATSHTHHSTGEKPVAPCGDEAPKNVSSVLEAYMPYTVVPPSFDGATERMVIFIRKLGFLCDGLCWVFREDFFRRGERVIAPACVEPSNESAAREIYARGIESGFGVCVTAEFTDGQSAYCWLTTVDNEADAVATWMPIESALKIVVREPFHKAHIVGSWSWAFRCRWSPAYLHWLSLDHQIPKRSAVLDA